MSKKHLYCLNIGDWSDDGHGMDERFYFLTNYQAEDIREAYKRTCAAIGIQLHDVYEKNYTNLPVNEAVGLFVECDEASISMEMKDILSSHGFSFDSETAEFDVYEDHIIFSPHDVFELFLWFVRYSMPDDFEWEEAMLDAESIIQSGFSHQFGYGVF